MIQEAKNSKGEWVPIEHWLYSRCGNSYMNPLVLNPGEEVLVPIKKHYLYDLASVTKVLASTLAFMKLYELYNIDIEIQKYQEGNACSLCEREHSFPNCG